MHSAKYLTVFAGAYLLQLVYGRIQGVVKLYVHYKDLLISLSRDFNSFTGQTDKTSFLRMRAGIIKLIGRVFRITLRRSILPAIGWRKIVTSGMYDIVGRA